MTAAEARHKSLEALIRRPKIENYLGLIRFAAQKGELSVCIDTVEFADRYPLIELGYRVITIFKNEKGTESYSMDRGYTPSGMLVSW